MRCRSALTKIDALRTGELPPDEQGAVKEHLRTCPSCDDSLADLGRLAEAVRRLGVAAPAPGRPELRIADSFDQVTTVKPAVWVAFSNRGLRMIHPGGSEAEFRAHYAERHGRALVRRPLPEAMRNRVLRALSGGEAARTPIDFGGTTGLEGEVMRMLGRIPRGEVRTYSWVARRIGRPRAVRAVANVIARNRLPFVVPCHRVVPAAGGIGEYAFGPAMKQDLLRREGVDVAGLEALARRHVRFIGSRTTHIACFPTCRDARRIREENRVPLPGAREAVEEGFRPCRRCQPFAAGGAGA